MAAWLIGFAILCATLVVIWVYVTRVRRPLNGLLHALRSSARAESYSGVLGSGGGRVAAVITAYNRMQERVGDHARELKAVREEERLILEVANSVSSELELNPLLRKIIATVTRVVGAERASLFLHDKTTDELWSRVSEGAITQEIRIPASTGLAGACFASGDVLNVADPYADPRFNRDVDRRTGQISRNILCIAVSNRMGETLGVLQLVNKVDGAFSNTDVSRLRAFSAQFAIALENAQLYEELKLLDKAKERVINHLSHELKTPLVILSGVLDLVKRKSEEIDDRALSRSLDRGYRNIGRLLSLQEQIDDILQQRVVDKREEVLGVIESSVDLLEDLAVHGAEPLAEIMSLMSERLEDIFGLKEVPLETVHAGDLLESAAATATASLARRDLEVEIRAEAGLTIESNARMLSTVVDGLVKNALENTPDEGSVRIEARRVDDDVVIEITDQGVGITEENQSLVFGGFFHTQTTEAYSSKRPYEFNAGGAGTDLLRIKCLSERHNFMVRFESERCRFIPRDDMTCPGRISRCEHVAGSAECARSGGSRFAIHLPVN